MEKYQPGTPLVLHTGISLQQLVCNLIDRSWPVALHNRTHVVNQVGRELVLGFDNENVVSVIRDLLSAIIENSCDGEIYIWAEKYSDVIMLLIEERNNNNGFALSFSIGSIEPYAARIGGHISIEGIRQRKTLISFSFPARFAA